MPVPKPDDAAEERDEVGDHRERVHEQPEADGQQQQADGADDPGDEPVGALRLLEHLVGRHVADVDHQKLVAGDGLIGLNCEPCCWPITLIAPSGASSYLMR